MEVLEYQSSKLTTITKPKCTGSIPKLSIAGTNTGTEINRIAVVSITHPKISSAILTMSRIMIGFSEIESNKFAICCGIPSIAIIALKGVAAAMMKTNTPQVETVSRIAFCNAFSVKSRVHTPRIIA